MCYDPYCDPKALRVVDRLRLLFPDLKSDWGNTGGNIFCFCIQLDDDNYLVWGTAEVTWGYSFAKDGDENPLKPGEIRESDIPSDDDYDEEALVKAIEQSILLHQPSAALHG